MKHWFNNSLELKEIRKPFFINLGKLFSKLLQKKIINEINEIYIKKSIPLNYNCITKLRDVNTLNGRVGNTFCFFYTNILNNYLLFIETNSDGARS